MHCGLGRAQGTFLWPVCITHLLGHHAAHLPVTLCAPRKSAPGSGSCEALRWLQRTSLPTSFMRRLKHRKGPIWPGWTLGSARRLTTASSLPCAYERWTLSSATDLLPGDSRRPGAGLWSAHLIWENLLSYTGNMDVWLA